MNKFFHALHQDAVQKFVKEAEGASRSKLTTSSVKEILSCTSANQAEKMIRKHLAGK